MGTKKAKELKVYNLRKREGAAEKVSKHPRIIELLDSPILYQQQLDVQNQINMHAENCLRFHEMARLKDKGR